MLLSKDQTEGQDQEIGMVQARSISFAPSGALQPNPPSQTIVTVSIKLTSVEHMANRRDEVGNNFTLEMTVTDGGQNKKGKFGPMEASIPVGGSLTVSEFLPVMTYSSLSAAKLRFNFRAETDFLSGVFIGETVGDDALSPSVNLFVVPVVLKTSSRQSTLIFRGRVDVTVLNGSNS